MGIEIDLFFVRGSELTCFLCGGRRLLGFSVWIEIGLVYVGGTVSLDFSLWVEIDLFLV